MNMQLLSSPRRHNNPALICFTLLMCFLLLTLSSCAGLGTDTGSVSPTPTKQTTPWATVFPAQPKLDSNSVNTEAISRHYLEKIQQIIAIISLYQKLGQMIMVEYFRSN